MTECESEPAATDVARPDPRDPRDPRGPALAGGAALLGVRRGRGVAR
ncbi:hypothetical protein [Nocardioides sp. P86]|nr:hypothetical protein [Nocardioides sp. P86]MCM3516120.1 hypothetical protein [Nocardioides sp. P86]